MRLGAIANYKRANAELQAEVDALEAENADAARVINNLGSKLKNMTGARDYWMAKYESIALYAPILAHDGEPIETGQTLYGLSDGKAWTVDGFDRKRKWSVWAHYGEHRKCLKPEWLTHERPDSWERIAQDLRAVNGDSFAHGGTADLGEIAERVERLAKEGA